MCIYRLNFSGATEQPNNSNCDVTNITIRNYLDQPHASVTIVHYCQHMSIALGFDTYMIDLINEASMTFAIRLSFTMTETKSFKGER